MFVLPTKAALKFPLALTFRFVPPHRLQTRWLRRVALGCLQLADSTGGMGPLPDGFPPSFLRNNWLASCCSAPPALTTNLTTLLINNLHCRSGPTHKHQN